MVSRSSATNSTRRGKEMGRGDCDVFKGWLQGKPEGDSAWPGAWRVG
jgi:hypothetical protein